MSSRNNLIIGILAVVIVVLGGVLLFRSSTKNQDQTPVADQMDMSSSTAQAQVNEASPSTQEAATDSGQTSNVKEFTVSGFNYGFSPNTLTVNKGDTVKITFKNSGGVHDFVINEFNVKTKTIRSGDSETVSFVANQAGTFQFYCSVANHKQMGMVGTLTVQ